MILPRACVAYAVLLSRGRLMISIVAVDEETRQRMSRDASGAKISGCKDFEAA